MDLKRHFSKEDIRKNKRRMRRCSASLGIVVAQLLSHVQLSCNPVDCCLPGSSVHGILQARILEWVAISFSGRSSPTGIEPAFPALAGKFFTAAPPGREAHTTQLAINKSEFGEPKARMFLDCFSFAPVAYLMSVFTCRPRFMVRFNFTHSTSLIIQY